MLWDNPKPPSFEDVGRLVNYENLSKVREAMLQVMQEDMPESEASAEPRPTESGTPVNGNASPTAPSNSSPQSIGG